VESTWGPPGAEPGFEYKGGNRQNKVDSEQRKVGSIAKSYAFFMGPKMHYRRGEIEQHRRRSAARKGGVLAGLSRGMVAPLASAVGQEDGLASLRRGKGGSPVAHCRDSRGRKAAAAPASGPPRGTQGGVHASHRRHGPDCWRRIAPLDKMGVGLGL
jgi:hypothetical protein